MTVKVGFSASTGSAVKIIATVIRDINNNTEKEVLILLAS